MASHGLLYAFLHALLLATLATTAFSTLSSNFYDESCPNALKTIQRVVQDAVQKERRMGASLLRLHFHDCFVNGCDGSVLLDPTPTIDSEKNAFPNNNSIRGFEVVDRIKWEVDKACGGPVVSCADILAVAARDSVVALGGPTWKVRLGRRDSTTASSAAANTDIPAPSFDLPQLIDNFKKQGLNEKDLVVLSGGHTIGYSQCVKFRDHLYNDSNINPIFAKELRYRCPRTQGQGDSNLAPLDPTPARFDVAYFSNLAQEKGLFRSDQALFNGGSTDALVEKYSYNTQAFYQDFSNSMIKMGNIKPLTGSQGQIRLNCRKGCDASVLLDDTANFTGEKTAFPNINSLRGFDVIDTIKSQVESLCPGVVSCADIVAVVARDSVVALGGPSWTVQLGRRDSTTASLSLANADLPAPFLNLSALITAFSNKGFTAKEMVALSGSHTIGEARCTNFRSRIYNETNIDSSFAKSLQANCPSVGGDNNLASLDAISPTSFDNAYFKDLVSKKGLLHSDQQLCNGGSTDSQVTSYSKNAGRFRTDFANAMFKMSKLSPLTGTSGQIRTNCRKVN